jgi:hypothetical protein
MLKIAAVLVALGLLSAGAAAAKGTDSDSFEIGLEGGDYHYAEPNFAKLDGAEFGLNATYAYKWSNDLVFKANVIADFGSLNYSSNGSGTSSGTTLYEQDYRAMIGDQLQFGRYNTVLPYIGLGFRMLFNGNGEQVTSTGAIGYDRRSEYLYIPLGATFDFKAGSWRIMPTAEYDYLIHGWQTSYLRDLGFDQNLTNDQTHGYGLRGDIMLKPPIDFYNLTVGPYLRYWNIGESNAKPLSVGGVPVGYGLEPQNETTEVGLRASIRF